MIEQLDFLTIIFLFLEQYHIFYNIKYFYLLFTNTLNFLDENFNELAKCTYVSCIILLVDVFRLVFQKIENSR